MKFYSYSNENKNYTKAISLQNVCSVELCNGNGKSAIRFSVRVVYANGRVEELPWLKQEEVSKVYNAIVGLLNE